MHFKMSSAKCSPFPAGLNLLIFPVQWEVTPMKDGSGLIIVIGIDTNI